MDGPTVSVVVSNYNHARFLPESLAAILGQSYRPQEVIVVDDGSTDNSVEVIEGFADKDPIVRLVRNEQNRGLIFTVKRGLDLASSDYVCFPAADDKLLSGFFERSIRLLARYPQAGLCSTMSGIINENGEYNGLVILPIVARTESFFGPEKALATLRQHGSWFMGNTAVYRRTALIEAGGPMPELDPYWDGFMDMVLALKYGACFIPEPLAMWRKMKGTYSEKMSGNLDTMLDIMRTARRLMQSTYRDLFPPDYVDEWEREFLFDINMNLMALARRDQIESIRRLLQSPNLVDRIFVASLRLSMGVERLVTKLYLFARLRRAHLWRVLARKLRHVADPRIRRLARGKRPSVQIAITKE